MLELVRTADGSNTIFNSSVGEHYHSSHGAVQESRHVFLKSGLQYYLENRETDQVRILEAGFGTGLNFLLTADFCTANNLFLTYTGIEAYPLDIPLIEQTNYKEYVSPDVWTKFHEGYAEAMKQKVKLNQYCELEIVVSTMDDYNTDQSFDIIYFDAFASVHQPEMWTMEALAHVCKFLKPGGVFVTYAITGNLKRIMKSIGFEIQKIPGAPGKREMLRSVKQ